MRPHRLRRPGERPLIAVIAPEPAAWLDHLLGGLEGDVRVIRLWPVVRRAGTAWARGRADRRIAARFALRQQLDRLAARWLPDGVEVVYAPSLAARRTFAEAARRPHPVRCHLIEDLPDLRQLHADLDRAAAVHPDAKFLLRYRADRRYLATQEAERALADVLHVRGDFAASVRRAAGHTSDRVTILGDHPAVAPRRQPPRPDQPMLLLAGLATARAGTYEALSALDAMPSATLLVRAGEGLEPVSLLSHPRVRTAGPREVIQLRDIDVVIAPSWCEAHLPELASAAARGIPIVATARAAGSIDLMKAGALIEPGDSIALVDAVRAVLSRPSR